MNEFDWIELIRKKSGHAPAGWLGIGDDAAVIPPQAKETVISTDVIVEGIDFDQSVQPSQAGRKALAVNLSDMAAMAAEPHSFFDDFGRASRLA